MIPSEKDKPYKEETPDYNAEGAVNNELKPADKDESSRDEEQPETGLDIESIIMG